MRSAMPKPMATTSGLRPGMPEVRWIVSATAAMAVVSARPGRTGATRPVSPDRIAGRAVAVRVRVGVIGRSFRRFRVRGGSAAGMTPFCRKGSIRKIDCFLSYRSICLMNCP